MSFPASARLRACANRPVLIAAAMLSTGLLAAPGLASAQSVPPGGTPAACVEQTNQDSFACGDGSIATASNATATGSLSRADSESSTAYGYRSNATNAGATAVGVTSFAMGDRSTAIGSNTNASGAGSVAIGSGSRAPDDFTVSFGSVDDGITRRVVNLSDGVADTDAATVGQVKAGDAATLASANGYTDTREAAIRTDMTAGDAATLAAANTNAAAGDAATLTSARTYADTGDARTLTSAMAYADLGDARTLGQANLYTDTQLSLFRSDFKQRIDSGVAGAAALSGIPQSVIPGKGMIGMAVGGRGDSVAFAIGGSKVYPSGFAWKAGAAFNGHGGDVTYQAGVGWAF